SRYSHRTSATLSVEALFRSPCSGHTLRKSACPSNAASRGLPAPAGTCSQNPELSQTPPRYPNGWRYSRAKADREAAAAPDSFLDGSKWARTSSRFLPGYPTRDCRETGCPAQILLHRVLPPPSVQ